MPHLLCTHVKCSNYLCPSFQQCRRHRLRLQAGQRAHGGSSGNIPSKGRTRPETKAPRKAGNSNSFPDLVQTLNPNGEEVEVPSLGWMWKVGGGSHTTSTSGSQTPNASPRPMPSAMSTVANLYEDRIKAKKSLGQNFLMDDDILQDIVAAAGVGTGDLVLEVGPGTGNLTKHLLAAGACLTAVEKDDTLYARLQNEYRDVAQLKLIHGDAIKVGLEDIIKEMIIQQVAALQSPTNTTVVGATAAAAEPSTTAPEASTSSSSSVTSSRTASSSRSRGTKTSGNRKVKVVANLPYNITKDLLLLLLPLGDLISDLHIMIQHEAAVRLTESTPGGPAWRAANIRTLFYCKPRYRFRIARHKYDPVPGVDGALVTFSLLSPGARPVVPSERTFHGLVVKAFSERRKKMRNSLQPLYSSEQVEAALAGCGLTVDARAQDLTLEQFVALSWLLHRQTMQEGLDMLRQPPSPPQQEQELGQGRE